MRYNRIALTRELPADLETPVGAYLKLANTPYSYLFESMQGGEQWGRYSFIGLSCREVVQVHGSQITLTRDQKIVERVAAADPSAWIKDYSARFRVKPDPALPRFSGGLVGYFGYDCVRHFEPSLGRNSKKGLATPDILLMLSDELVVFDNLRATLTLVVHTDPEAAKDMKRAHGRLDEIEARLATSSRAAKPSVRKPAKIRFTSGFDRAHFSAAVQRIKHYIAAGDVMQVVLSQRLSAPFKKTPLALYRALRRLNPSPYLFCLNLGDHHVVGASPEILVRAEHGRITVRPLAGTRPRGATPEQDRALEQELLADPKELAEHLMLIDLGRNDVGRVAETGSVQLTEKMVIERYSHVMHIVSNVQARLKKKLHPLDALAATFPAGTLSGAPKVRAMQIIDELEPVRRGIYGGAVGYLGWDGNMDVAIAIRTAVIQNGTLHVQAGAGIVADSHPVTEWEETMNKAKAMMKAAELA